MCVCAAFGELKISISIAVQRRAWTAELAGTTRVRCCIVGGGDTRLCRHPDYDKQSQHLQLQQLQSDDGREDSNTSINREVGPRDTCAAYVTADLAFRQASAAAAAALQSLGDSEMCRRMTLYTMDDEATARLDGVSRDQQTSTDTSRRNTSKYMYQGK